MKQVHGIADAEVKEIPGAYQAVRVVDWNSARIGILHTHPNMALLTPTQARFIAKCLVEAAERLRKR